MCTVYSKKISISHRKLPFKSKSSIPLLISRNILNRFHFHDETDFRQFEMKCLGHQSFVCIRAYRSCISFLDFFLLISKVLFWVGNMLTQGQLLGVLSFFWCTKNALVAWYQILIFWFEDKIDILLGNTYWSAKSIFFGFFDHKQSCVK